MTQTDEAPRPDVTDMVAVHAVFRDTLGAAPALIDGASDGDAARAALVANYYDNILHFLEVHHEAEEKLVFPLLRQRCPADGPLVDQLEAEHVEALALLQQAQRAVTAWQAGDGDAAPAEPGTPSSPCGRSWSGISTPRRPRCCRCAGAYLSPRGVGASLATRWPSYRGDKVWLILGLIRERMNDEQRAAMLEHMPPPAQEMWTGFGEQAFKELSAEVEVPVVSHARGTRLDGRGYRRPTWADGAATAGRSVAADDADEDSTSADAFADARRPGVRRRGSGPVTERGGRRRRRGGLDKVTAHLVGGEQRPEQQEMCRAVAEALVTRTHLAVQAGTGTGKSLAYLVPAALSGQKVVVATATKALQDQLAEKDLPQVEAGLGCRSRWTSPCSRDAATTSAGNAWPRWGREGSRASCGVPRGGAGGRAGGGDGASRRRGRSQR